jgi:CrcB protein
MSPLTFLLVSIVGGLGAALRLLIDGLVKARLKVPFPVGTTIINVTGSFLLGLVTGLTTAAVLPTQWQLIIGGGLLGGYTTFSTASFETVRLIQDRRYVAGLLNGVGMLTAAVAAALFGLWLASLF